MPTPTDPTATARSGDQDRIPTTAATDCHHDDTFNGVCVWCRAEVGTAPTDEQARIVGDLLGIRLTRAESNEGSPR